MIYQYFCDRTSLFMKVQKQFEFWPVTLAMLASLALGLFTLKKPEKDLGFLNRDQTDEWKGWMQIAILIYHYWGASKVSGIYNPIRVLVAAYLFMSGYGHFYFYYKKADFGLARIAAVLIRLNLLTLVLAYIQDTDYLSYYFSPLTTLWFIVIWLTMYIGHTYNATNAPFLLAKIGVSAALMTAMHKLTWPLDRLFGVYNAVFATQWNAREWSFRVTLDMWIVYVGMLSAYAVIAFNDNKLWDRPSWPIVRKYGTALAAVAMIGYIAFELQFDKFTYNTYHPYISFVPVLAFAVLRNATPLLRSTSSKAYIWIGQWSVTCPAIREAILLTHSFIKLARDIHLPISHLARRRYERHSDAAALPTLADIEYGSLDDHILVRVSPYSTSYRRDHRQHWRKDTASIAVKEAKRSTCQRRCGRQQLRSPGGARAWHEKWHEWDQRRSQAQRAFEATLGLPVSARTNRQDAQSAARSNSIDYAVLVDLKSAIPNWPSERGSSSAFEPLTR